MSGQHTPVERARLAALALGLIVALVYAGQAFPTATAGPAVASTAPSSVIDSTADDVLAAPAQTALDQILGPGQAEVSASAIYAAPSSSTSTTYSGKMSAPLSQAMATGPGYSASTVNNGVGVIQSTTVVPGGQIVRLSVAVTVDSALRPAPSLRSVRNIVTAAMGIQRARGDRLTVQSLALPTRVTVPAASPSGLVAALTPYLNSIGGVLVAATFSVLFLLERRRLRGR
jgi:flagellar M-ring protein FliF